MPPRSSSTKRSRPTKAVVAAEPAEGSDKPAASPAAEVFPILSLGEGVLIAGSLSLLLAAVYSVATGNNSTILAALPTSVTGTFDSVLAKASADPFTTVVTILAIVFGWTTLSLWAEANGGLGKALKETVGGALIAMPGIKGAVDSQMDDMLKDLEDSLLGDVVPEERVLELPAKGFSAARVNSIIEASAAKDKAHWASGKHSGTVYHGGEEFAGIISSALAKFSLSNPLHPDCFPALRKMDAEIVAMTLSLFSPTDDTCGTTTSGGTESILLACKAYRDRAKTVKGVTRPEMIVPDTAHAAFMKAAHYFGIKIIILPVDQKTFRVDPAAVAKRITPNTVMLVGSAPSFAQGVVDNIPALAALAKKHDIGMHVDCCLGSFMIPFARSIGGRDIPDFDFSVPGVTSISCDTHKYGFAPKGSSVIMWCTKEWRFHQYYVCADWTGGIYATPTLAGSRPGANLAATWAVMVHMGRSGYTKAAATVFKAADVVEAGVKSIPELEQFGSTDHAVVAFGAKRDGSSGVDIYKVVNAMAKRGWSLNSLQRPACVHLCITYANSGMADEFVEDLASCVEEVKANPDKYKGGQAAMYGSSTAMAPQGMLNQVAGMYMDTVYRAE